MFSVRFVMIFDITHSTVSCSTEDRIQSKGTISFLLPTLKSPSPYTGYNETISWLHFWLIVCFHRSTLSPYVQTKSSFYCDYKPSLFLMVVRKDFTLADKFLFPILHFVENFNSILKFLRIIFFDLNVFMFYSFNFI